MGPYRPAYAHQRGLDDRYLLFWLNDQSKVMPHCQMGISNSFEKRTEFPSDHFIILCQIFFISFHSHILGTWNPSIHGHCLPDKFVASWEITLYHLIIFGFILSLSFHHHRKLWYLDQVLS